jgi:hypothetical protein
MKCSSRVFLSNEFEWLSALHFVAMIGLFTGPAAEIHRPGEIWRTNRIGVGSIA